MKFRVTEIRRNKEKQREREEGGNGGGREREKLFTVLLSKWPHGSQHLGISEFPKWVAKAQTPGHLFFSYQ